MSKIAYNKWILVSCFSLLFIPEIFAQGGGNGDPCQIPFSPCWCIQNNHPCANQEVPINNELWVLMLAGLIMSIYMLKKRGDLKKIIN